MRRNTRTWSKERHFELLEPRMLLSAGLFADPISPDHPLWAIPRGTAVVDGVLDEADWANSLEIFRTQATRPNSAVWVRMMWSDAGIFLAVEARDEHIWADGMGGGSGNRWEIEADDSVTFYFDPDNSRDQFFQPDDRSIGVNLGAMGGAVNGPGAVSRWKYVQGDGAGWAADALPGGMLPGGVQYASTIRGTVNNSSDVDEGWTIEMFVPWSALNMPAPGHGTTMGMNFDIIFDNDGGARNMVDNRSHPDPNVRYLQPLFVDDHIQGAHSSQHATLAGLRGPINYAEVMFIDARAGARPARITDLSVSNAGAFGAHLHFTAPAGTIAGLGHVSGYEIRYAAAPITTDAAWMQARVFRQQYTPRLRGLAEMLRIAELSPGQTYHIAIRAVDAAGNLGEISSNAVVTTAALPYSGYRGRIIPAPMGNMLMFENGDPFIVVGDHLGITWGYSRQLFPGDVWDNINGMYHNFSTHVPAEGHFSGYFDLLAAHGVNTMRVYLELQNVAHAGNPQVPRGLHWLEHNAGQFNPDMRTYMHNVLREAASRGIHIIFTPFDTFSYDEAFGLEGPWSTNFGGPLSDINSFFQTPGTLAMAKARMDTVIAWANQSPYRDFVIGWEPMTEWDSYEWTLHPEGNAEPGRETEMRRRAMWINELADHIRRQDPDRLVLNSTIVRDPRGPLARQIFHARNFDALTPHLYSNSSDGPLLNPQQDKSVLPAIENGMFTAYWLTHRIDSRPILNGEWGMTRVNWPNNRPQYGPGFTQQQDEALYRVMIWSGFASGQLGTGLRINTEELQWNFMLMTPMMRQHQLRFATFLSGGLVGIDYAHFAYRNLSGRIGAQAAGHRLHAWGITDSQQGIAYVLRDGNVALPPVAGGRLHISGLGKNRIFDVEIWSPSSGVLTPIATLQGMWSPTGELVIDLPQFGDDLALKFRSRPVAPQAQTLVSMAHGQSSITFGLGLDRRPYGVVVDSVTGQSTVQDIGVIANFRGRVVDMTPFSTADGMVHLALTDDRGHVWHLTGNLATGAWSATDLTSLIGAPGLSGDLTTYQPSWGSIHIAGLDARGHAINYWWAPGLATWAYTDLTEMTGGEPMAGGLTGYVSGWDGLHLAGLNQRGEVIVYWWAPGIEAIAGRDTWLSQNMTTDFDGPTFVGQLDAFVTPWGGLNVAGRTAAGEMFTYWWSPQLKLDNLAAGRPDVWEVANITESTGGAVLSQGTEVAVSTDGGINIFGLDAAGGVHLFRWLPGGAWEAQAVSQRVMAPAVVFPLAAASAGNRLQLSARREDGALVLFVYRLDLDEWSVIDTGQVAAA